MPDEKWLKRSPDISLKNEYQKGQTRERKKERGTERETRAREHLHSQLRKSQTQLKMQNGWIRKSAREGFFFGLQCLHILQLDYNLI